MPITTPRGLIGRLFTWKTSPPKWLIILAPITLNVGFGIYPVVLKLFAAGQTPEHKANPYVFTLYRGMGTCLVLFPVSYLVEGPILVPDLRTSLIFLLLGFLVFINLFAYITGAYIITPDIATAFQPLIPVWTAILTIVLCTEQVPPFTKLHSWAKVGGVLLAAGGAITLALSGYSPDPSDSTFQLSQQIVGYLSLFLETCIAALFYILQKKLIFKAENCIWKDYPLAQTGYIYLTATVFGALFCSYYILSGRTKEFHIPHHSLPALAYAVLINSTLCYFLITWSNRYLPSSVMTAFWPLQVFSTVVVAYLMLGDTLTTTQVLSASAIIAGLSLVIYSNRVVSVA